MSVPVPDIAITAKVVRSVNVLRKANDNSLGGGLVGAFVIILLNCLVENVPTVPVKRGQVLHATLGLEHMSMPELRAALCKEGITTMSEVRYTILEEDGHVSVIHRRPEPA